MDRFVELTAGPSWWKRGRGNPLETDEKKKKKKKKGKGGEREKRERNPTAHRDGGKSWERGKHCLPIKTWKSYRRWATPTGLLSSATMSGNFETRFPLSLSLSFRLLLACLFYYFQVANGIGRFADRRYHQPRKRESRVLNFLSIEALRRTVRRVLRNFDLLLLLLLLLSLAGRFRQRANCARRVHPVSSLCHMK